MHNCFSEYYRPALHEAERQQLVGLVTLANELADQASRIEQQSGGNHPSGDRLIRACHARLSHAIDRPFRDGKNLKDCLLPGGPLDRTDYRVLRDQTHPLPRLMLARIDPWKGMGAWTLLEIIAGPDILQRICPVNDYLLADGTGARYVDARPLNAAESSAGGESYSWMLRDAFVRVVTEQYYLLERGGHLELARLARLLQLEQIQGAFGLKLFCDYLRFPPPELHQFRRDLERLRQATRLAFQPVAPEGVLDCTSLAESAYAQMEEDFEQTILSPMSEIVGRVQPLGGVSPDRAWGLVYPQWHRWQVPPPADVSEALRMIDEEAKNFAARTVTALREKRSQSKKPAARFLSLDVADLESANRVRKYMAVTDLIRPEFEQFLQDPKIAERYQLLGKKLPCCPMPMEGTEPLTMRLKTALFCLLVADLRPSVNRVPEVVFQWTPPANMIEEEVKANKSMHDKLCIALRHRMVVEELRRLSPVAQRLCEAWTTLYEERFRHAGCGVDSVDNLLVPCVLFHTQHLDHLLAPELPWYRESWLDLRRLVEEWVAAYLASHWAEARRLVTLMFEHFRGMQLRLMPGIPIAPIANPIALPIASFFDAPKTFFSERMLQVREAAAPIQVAMAPPGDPAAYARLVEDLQPPYSPVATNPGATAGRASHSGRPGAFRPAPRSVPHGPIPAWRKPLQPGELSAPADSRTTAFGHDPDGFQRLHERRTRLHRQTGCHRDGRGPARQPECRHQL